ncbi:hypothetical protein H312_02433 [Anncaliia algerae PRA339]|uniref:Uncharacterized protein n=1 Tax=Anncaliia algerae PRA339 TaxID=1288291 RepID=A0A059EZ25_9MICR|nr:hypothetical protein H312_02433 [Anncaliia algerae PRA339]
MNREKLKQLLLKHLITRPSQDEIVRELSQNNIPIILYNSVIIQTLKKVGKRISHPQPKFLSLKKINKEDLILERETFKENSESNDISLNLIKTNKKDHLLDEEEIKNRIYQLKNAYDIEDIEEGVVDDLIRGCREFMRKRIKKEDNEKK